MGGGAPEVAVYLYFHVYAYFHSSANLLLPLQEIKKKPTALVYSISKQGRAGAPSVNLTGITVQQNYRCAIITIGRSTVEAIPAGTYSTPECSACKSSKKDEADEFMHTSFLLALWLVTGEGGCLAVLNKSLSEHTYTHSSAYLYGQDM